jgi:uncharacterized protein
MAADLVGSGWAFPGAFTSAGTVALATGTRELDGAIQMIVGTAPGQRVMRPEFGCAIYDYIFDPLTPRTLGLVELAVRDALLRWEPRIDLETLVATLAAQEGVLDIEIGYRVKATNDHRNLVFPFYVIPREVEPREVVPSRWGRGPPGPTRGPGAGACPSTPATTRRDPHDPARTQLGRPTLPGHRRRGEAQDRPALPGWTDHNVSDPGVALIELFAWMSEMILYRMNQVPERLYVKFLELIGIELYGASTAKGVPPGCPGPRVIDGGWTLNSALPWSSCAARATVT